MANQNSYTDRPPPRLISEIVAELEDVKRLRAVTEEHARDDAATKFRLRSLEKLEQSLYYRA